MKKIFALVLALTCVMSVCVVSSNAAAIVAGNFGSKLEIPSTIAPGETLEITLCDWVISDDNYTYPYCTASTNQTITLVGGNIEDIIDVTTLDISPVKGFDATSSFTMDFDPEYHEVVPGYKSDISFVKDQKMEFIVKITAKVKESVAVGTKFTLKSDYGVFLSITGDALNQFNLENNPISSNECTVVAAHKAAKPLGGQIKTTVPAGLRLGFDIADLGENYSSIKIEINKEGGEKVTVPVTKFYNTERTQFTVCVKNIPAASKDVKFTAKAIITFADGKTTTSDAITLSYNDIATAIDANWNK